jgi:hypothetical protein
MGKGESSIAENFEFEEQNNVGSHLTDAMQGRMQISQTSDVWK